LHITRTSDGSYAVVASRSARKRLTPAEWTAKRNANADEADARFAEREARAALCAADTKYRDALPHRLHSCEAGARREACGGLQPRFAQSCGYSAAEARSGGRREATSLLLYSAAVPKEYYKVFCPHDRAYFARCASCERNAKQAAANLAAMLRGEWGWLGAHAPCATRTRAK
jgi:hypothetical protein